MLISIVNSPGICFQKESIHGNRAVKWHSENQVTDALGSLKEMQFVFRKGRKKTGLENSKLITIGFSEKNLFALVLIMFIQVMKLLLDVKARTAHLFSSKDSVI